MRLLKTASVFCIAATLSACAVNMGHAVGTSFLADATKESLDKEFPPKVANRKTVLLKLGPPNKNSTIGGYEVWTYQYTKSGSVAVLFIAAPIVSEIKANFYFSEGTGALEKIDLMNSGK